MIFYHIIYLFMPFYDFYLSKITSQSIKPSQSHITSPIPFSQTLPHLTLWSFEHNSRKKREKSLSFINFVWSLHHHHHLPNPHNCILFFILTTPEWWHPLKAEEPLQYTHMFSPKDELNPKKHSLKHLDTKTIPGYTKWMLPNTPSRSTRDSLLQTLRF